MATSWTAPRIALVVIVGFIAYRCGGALTSGASSASPAQPTTSRASSATTAVSEGKRWLYQSSQDPMTGKFSPMLSLSSRNSLSFHFPYAGENRGTLVARMGKSGRAEVYFSIDRGQIICHSGDCPVEVRFDDAAPIRFSGTHPADHSSTTVFLDNPARFLAKATKATRILVQFNAYQDGSHILEFATAEPLVWPPK